MQPLASLPSTVASTLIGVLADIDDTITTDGRLTPEAYNAMSRVQHAGLLMIPITGRPAGWCDHIARLWPVDGVVGENGAFYFRYDHQARKFLSRFEIPDQQAQDNRTKMKAIAERILAEVPGTALASDQPYRIADIAIDFCEDVDPLPPHAVNQIVEMMTAEGLTAKVSSIHVNGWFGTYDKLTMTRTFLQDCFSIDIEKARERFVFVGDSPNDQPMFSFFPNAVGVANLRGFSEQLDQPPAYITTGEGGTGFSELVDALICARSEATV